MIKIRKSVGVIKEGILIWIPFIILGTKVLDCQHGKDRKVSAKMKAKEPKAEKKLNLLFVKWNQRIVAFKYE